MMLRQRQKDLADVPCIPFLPLILTDLTFIEGKGDKPHRCTARRESSNFRHQRKLAHTCTQVAKASMCTYIHMLTYHPQVGIRNSQVHAQAQHILSFCICGMEKNLSSSDWPPPVSV